MSWLTAFVDVPASRHAAETQFWQAVTGYGLSPARGSTGEFATLVPPVGDAYLRVQRIDSGPARIHLDVHVDDLDAAVAESVRGGATATGATDGVRVMRSPGGFVFCLVGAAESVVAPPADWGTHRSVVDQVSIDVPAPAYDDECRFWAGLLDRETVPSDRHEEFRFLPGPPLRVLMQRLGEASGPARAHLDVAAGDRDAEVQRHEVLGARVVRRTPRWTTLLDPADIPYCITVRPA